MEEGERYDGESVLVEGSEEGTSESRGLRDNLWEGKERGSYLLRSHGLLCCIDSPSALLVNPHSIIYRAKTPPKQTAAAHFNIQRS